MTCAYGVHIVGRVLIVFGVCDAAASVGFGFIIKKIGRIPIFILGAVINVLVIIVMLSWSPTRDQVAVVYVLAALWGTADAIWQTQINALYGVLFANDEEAAFSNYRLWESLGNDRIRQVQSEMKSEIQISHAKETKPFAVSLWNKGGFHAR